MGGSAMTATIYGDRLITDLRIASKVLLAFAIWFKILPSGTPKFLACTGSHLNLTRLLS